MFQFALPASLFRLMHRGPVLVPLLQLPNRRPTEGDAAALPLIYFSKMNKLFWLHWGSCAARTPRPPCGAVYTATPTGGNRRMAEPMLQYAAPASPYRWMHRGPVSAPA